MSISLGKKGEDIAAELLKKRGYTLIERNFTTRLGEIDLIMKKNEELVFCEVKTRSSDFKGKPYENVTPRKLRHLQKTIQIFLLQHPEYQEYHHKILVISILLKDNQSEIEVFEL